MMYFLLCLHVIPVGGIGIQKKEDAVFYNSITSGVQAYRAKTKEILASGRSAVAYHLSGGRFGDNLIAYLHAKWISYKYALPLVYVPFEYSSDLVLSDAELMATIDNAGYLKRTETRQVVAKEFWLDTLTINPNEGILYLVPWFQESLQDYERLEDGRPYFYVNWEDEYFLKEIRSLIAPRAQLELIKLPSDKVTVAVHVRRNSNGFDLSLSFKQGDYIDPSKQYLDDFFPLKCINDDFFIFGIKKIAELFPDKQLYVYIFTDDKNPGDIVEKYKKIINNPAITFDYRHDVHDHTKHVLEDFFSMLTFDCLVRSDSNFSLVASKLGDYKLVISPAGYQVKNAHPVIVRANIALKM